MTPSAVPYPQVASAPALQCVSTPPSSGINAPPNAPIVLQAAMSSSYIACASARILSCTWPSDQHAGDHLLAVGLGLLAVGRAPQREPVRVGPVRRVGHRVHVGEVGHVVKRVPGATAGAEEE